MFRFRTKINFYMIKVEFGSIDAHNILILLIFQKSYEEEGRTTFVR